VRSLGNENGPVNSDSDEKAEKMSSPGVYAIAQRWLGGSVCVQCMYVCMSVAVRASCRDLGV